MNIPNLLTTFRFVLIPVFGVFLYKEQYLVAVVAFLVGGLTDVLDGYIARKFDMITSFGKLADPVADKLMQITALVLLSMQGFVHISVLLVVIAKEVFMGLGSITLYKKDKVVVSANWYGKLATVIFYFAIVMTIVIKMSGLSSPYNAVLIDVFIGLAVVSTLFAFFMYSLAFRKIRSDSR